MQYSQISDHSIEMSCDQPIVLEKMFGPTIFADLRITAILERGGWVVERLMNRGWTEIMVIPAQVDADFSNNET